MEAIERITPNNDWITLIFLGIFFLIASASLIDKERLRQLFILPFDNYYVLNYDSSNKDTFTILLFIASNLIFGLFIYFLGVEFSTDTHRFTPYGFLKTLIIIILYWFFKYASGQFIAFLFEITKSQSKLLFLKASYFFSSNLSLLFFLIFSVYLFDNNRTFLLISSIVYLLLLVIRYYHFLSQYKREIMARFFYFILYLCALEIAPLLIAIKIGF